MRTRRNRPRSEWARTSTKYSCFIVFSSPGRAGEDYEAGILCTGSGPLATRTVAPRAHSSPGGLRRPRVGPPRLFLLVRVHFQLRPHGLEGGKLQRVEIGSRFAAVTLPESAEGSKPDQ